MFATAQARAGPPLARRRGPGPCARETRGGLRPSVRFGSGLASRSRARSIIAARTSVRHAPRAAGPAVGAGLVMLRRDVERHGECPGLAGQDHEHVDETVVAAVCAADHYVGILLEDVPRPARLESGQRRGGLRAGRGVRSLGENGEPAPVQRGCGRGPACRDRRMNDRVRVGPPRRGLRSFAPYRSRFRERWQGRADAVRGRRESVADARAKHGGAGEANPAVRGRRAALQRYRAVPILPSCRSSPGFPGFAGRCRPWRSCASPASSAVTEGSVAA